MLEFCTRPSCSHRIEAHSPKTKTIWDCDLILSHIFQAKFWEYFEQTVVDNCSKTGGEQEDPNYEHFPPHCWHSFWYFWGTLGCFFKQVNVLALLHKVVIGSPALFLLREFSSDWGLFGAARASCLQLERDSPSAPPLCVSNKSSSSILWLSTPALLNPALIQGRVSSSRLLSNMPGPKVF